MSVESVTVTMPEDNELTLIIEVESEDSSPPVVTTLSIKTKGKEN